MSLIKSLAPFALCALVFANVASAQTNPNLSGTVVGPTTATENSAAEAATTVNTSGAGARVINAVILDNAFDPHNIIVAAGSTVTWRNQDPITHTLFADRGEFSSGSIPPGGSFSVVFPNPGTYLYYDPAFGGAGGEGMFGIVVVLPTGTQVPSTGGGGQVLGEGTGVPFLPNTGDGGTMMANVVLLGLSALIAISGLFLLRKHPTNFPLFE